MGERQTNILLGYPADARLLIINADDFGMCHSVNEAILRTLQERVASSTTLLVPCPWTPHAMQLLKEHPDIPFGVHLTLICDFSNCRWGPITSKHKVPSLIDEAGYFYGSDRIPEFLAQAKLNEVEIEFRAQIKAQQSVSTLCTRVLNWGVGITRHSWRHKEAQIWQSIAGAAPEGISHSAMQSTSSLRAAT